MPIVLLKKFWTWIFQARRLCLSTQSTVNANDLRSLDWSHGLSGLTSNKNSDSGLPCISSLTLATPQIKLKWILHQNHQSSLKGSVLPLAGQKKKVLKMHIIFWQNQIRFFSYISLYTFSISMAWLEIAPSIVHVKGPLNFYNFVIISFW